MARNKAAELERTATIGGSEVDAYTVSMHSFSECIVDIFYIGR
jgi:hypothetical protein